MDETIILDSWCKFFKNIKIIDLDYGGEICQDSITETQKKTKDYLLENQHQFLQLILKNLFENFPEIQKVYGCDDPNSTYYLPNPTSINSFKNLIEPHTIYILNVEKEDLCYMGFAFHCCWDQEHGYGVMSHKERIVDVGGSDTAFLNWIAEKDAKNEK